MSTTEMKCNQCYSRFLKWKYLSRKWNSIRFDENENFFVLSFGKSYFALFKPGRALVLQLLRRPASIFFCKGALNSGKVAIYSQLRLGLVRELAFLIKFAMITIFGQVLLFGCYKNWHFLRYLIINTFLWSLAFLDCTT